MALAGALCWSFLYLLIKLSLKIKSPLVRKAKKRIKKNHSTKRELSYRRPKAGCDENTFSNTIEQLRHINERIFNE